MATSSRGTWEDHIMAYDEGLATRIRDAIGDRPGLAEKQMFGGLAFLLDGNMACGVRGDDLMVRVGADAADAALGESGVRPSEMKGRPMKGWLLVDADGHAEDDDLRRWVDRGLAYASSLPPK
jgi:TfoX N-terminal domain